MIWVGVGGGFIKCTPLSSYLRFPCMIWISCTSMLLFTFLFIPVYLNQKQRFFSEENTAPACCLFILYLVVLMLMMVL